MNQETIVRLSAEFERELFQSVLPFWQQYSIDEANGGYHNCLDRQGRFYDPTKYMWLHGRQIWLFSKLYNDYAPEREWLRIAGHGLEFMRRHALAGNGRVYFSLNAQGQPVYLQRKLFSECFYAMALAEYGRAAGREDLLAEARQQLNYIWLFSQDPAQLGRPRFAGAPPFQSLAVPMILLNVVEEVYGDDFEPVAEQVQQCLAQVRQHFVDGVVYENVLPGGTLHDSADGRLLNPGHAIEAGWFLKHWARRLKDEALHETASQIIRRSFRRGWDAEYGGLFYFLDADGKSPVQLEWDRKLWWPHCEALYAWLLLATETGAPGDWDAFQQVKAYTFAHFPDPHHGEWYGYLDRAGAVSQDFKGGPYKGCFHVPRALWNCLCLLGW